MNLKKNNASLEVPKEVVEELRSLSLGRNLNEPTKPMMVQLYTV